MKRCLYLLSILLYSIVQSNAQSFRSFENGILIIEDSDFAMNPFEISIRTLNSDEIKKFLPDYFTKTISHTNENIFCSGEKKITLSSLDRKSVIEIIDCEYEIFLGASLYENALKFKHGIRIGQTSSEILYKMKMNFPIGKQTIQKIHFQDVDEANNVDMFFENNILVSIIFSPQPE